MGLLAAGQVVLLPFPFSDLKQVKLRPVVIVALAGRGDWLVCQITSNPKADVHALPLTQDSFDSGGLRHVSYMRPAKLFTADEGLIVSTIGTLNQESFVAAQEAIIAAVRGALPY